MMGASLRRRLGWLLAVLAVVLTVILIAAPSLLSTANPVATGDDLLSAPSAAHLFGTDQLGRDVFSRVITGARPVLLASFLGVALATVAGVALGVLGGAAPKFVSTVVMRVIDVLLALPVLLIALLILAIFGPGVSSIALAVGIAFTPAYARVVESSVRKLRSVEYVQAARVFGSSASRTALRHLLPNLATEVVVLVSSGIGWAVLTSTTLSFLGLGVHLPTPDWGSDLAAGGPYLQTAWWLSTFPGLAITITILLANFIGDQVALAMDPRSGVRLKSTMRLALPNLGGARTRGAPFMPGGAPSAPEEELP
jgi:peptide/nickel transport system permease protein